MILIEDNVVLKKFYIMPAELSAARANEIAMIVLQDKLENDGELSRVVPSEIKRQVHNASKKMGIPPKEIAEFMKLMLQKMHTKNIAELDKIIGS